LFYNSFSFESIIILLSFANVDLENNNWYHNNIDFAQQWYQS